MQYTEFTAYAALLTGAPPPTLQKSMVVRHRQTWKLREHHLVVSDPCSDSGIDVDIDSIDPLPGGDPLRSYFPTGTQIMEHRDGIEVQDVNCKNVLRYQRAPIPGRQPIDDDDYISCVQDVIITGEVRSITESVALTLDRLPGSFSMGSIQPYRASEALRWLR